MFVEPTNPKGIFYSTQEYTLLLRAVTTPFFFVGGGDNKKSLLQEPH